MTHPRRVAAALMRRPRRMMILSLLAALGLAALGAGITHAAGHSATPPAGRLMLTAAQWAQDQRSPTMDSMFPPNGFAMQHPILIWWLALELLGLLAFPFTFLLLRNLVDRGFVVAKTIGLLILGYGVWITASTGVAVYDRALIWVVMVVFAVAAGALGFVLRKEILPFARQEWRSVLSAEAVFLTGFVLFLLLRMWYPDLHHQYSPVSPTNAGDGRMGEKQMEMAFLNAVVRSRVFPPYDPFYAHGYINYYYYGYVLVGTLCKLTQIVPATGFNLAIASFGAMLVGNVFSVVLSLTRRITPGVIAAAFVGFFGNLNGAWQLIRDLMEVATVHSSLPIFGGVADVLSGAQQVIFARVPIRPFDFWESTRILPPPGVPITEFPYFTFLFADLHAHLLAYPMTAAALALSVSLVLGWEGWSWRVGLSALLGGVVLGSLIVTNPWDFPTYLGIIVLGALVGAYALRRRFDRGVILRPILWAAALTVLSFLLYLPFERSYQTVFQTGIGLTRDITPTALQAPGGVCPPDLNPCPEQVRDTLVTPLRFFLEHFGLFFFLILSYLLVLLAYSVGGWRRAKRLALRAQFAVYYRDRLPRVRRVARVVRRLRGPEEPVIDGALAAGLIVLVGGLFLLQYNLLAFLLLTGGVAILLLVRLARSLPDRQLYVLTLVLVPLALSALTQIVYIKDFLNGGQYFRMNTIFKFYNQSWVLYAVCAACALYYFYVERMAEPAASPAPESGAPEPDGHSGDGVVALDSDSLIPAAQAAVPAQAGSLATATVVETASTSPLPESSGAAPIAPPEPDIQPESARRVWPWDRALRFVDHHALWSFALALLVAGSLIYTYAGTISRETYREAWLPENSVPFTLDGMAFMKVSYPGDYAGISWLNAHVRGAPVMAEAYDRPAGYNWYSRVSVFTGLPDIMNGIHEGEQRPGDDFDLRDADIKTLYSSSDPAAAWPVIHRYGVKYIYVGWLERHCLRDVCYPSAGLAKFDGMVGHGLRVAFRSGSTAIYQVTRP